MAGAVNRSPGPSPIALQDQFSVLPQDRVFANATESFNWLFLITLRKLSQDKPYVTVQKAEGWRKDVSCQATPDTKLRYILLELFTSSRSKLCLRSIQGLEALSSRDTSSHF